MGMGTPCARAGVLFDSSAAYPVSSAMGSVVTSGDFNGDGRRDIVSVARFNPAVPVSVLLGQGDGSFRRVDSVAAGGVSIAAGDLDRDGKLDVVLPGSTSLVTILFGKGDGTFESPVGIGGGGSGGISTSSIVVGQLGGADPGLDIALVSSGGLQVLLGKGDGTFSGPATYPGWSAGELVIADFTGDQHNDVALTRAVNYPAGEIAVLPGSATGALGAAITTPTDAPLGSPVATDDDGDGVLDIVAVERAMFSNNATLYYGAGDGTFEDPLSLDLGSPPLSVSVGDFDRDGEPDYAAETYAGDLFVLLATGDVAAAELSPVAADAPISATVADLNGDRADDVASATWSGKVIVSRNAPGADVKPSSVAFAPQTAGTAAVAQTITVTNTGIPDLTIAAVSVDAADFSAGGTCRGATVPAGGSCNVTVGFAPATPGGRRATLTIAGDQAGGAVRIPLSGTGVAPVSGAARPDTTPPRLAFKARRDLRVTLSCSEACHFDISAKIDARTARRLRLAKKALVFARSRGNLPPGVSTTVRLRLSRKVSRAFAKQRAVLVTVAATASDAAGNRTTSRVRIRLSH
jgi:hypothetical protein